VFNFTTNLVRVHAQSGKDTSGHACALEQEAQEEMFGGYGLAISRTGLAGRDFERPIHSWGLGEALRNGAGPAKADFSFDRGGHCLSRHASVLHDFCDRASLGPQQTQQEMLCSDEVVIQASRLRLRTLQGQCGGFVKVPDDGGQD